MNFPTSLMVTEHKDAISGCNEKLLLVCEVVKICGKPIY